MKKDFTSFIFIIIILFTISATIFSFYFFNNIRNKNEYISKIEQILNKKRIARDNIKILKKKFTELSKINNKINGYFVDPDKINLFVDYLENLGIIHNTKLVVSDVEISKDEKNKILAKISIEGDFNSVMKTFSFLENSPFYVNITQSFLNKKIIEKNLENTENSNNNSLWQMDISFSVLSYIVDNK